MQHPGLRQQRADPRQELGFDQPAAAVLGPLAGVRVSNVPQQRHLIDAVRTHDHPRHQRRDLQRCVPTAGLVDPDMLSDQLLQARTLGELKDRSQAGRQSWSGMSAAARHAACGRPAREERQGPG